MCRVPYYEWFLCIFLSLLPWAWTRIRHFGCHSVSVIHSFILCVVEVVKLQYCVLCSHESFFTAWKSFLLFSCSVTPLAICTTVTFYIVLHYSNNSCGEGMQIQVLHTWLFDHAIIFIIYLLPCASCCIIELRSHLQYMFISSK